MLCELLELDARKTTFLTSRTSFVATRAAFPGLVLGGISETCVVIIKVVSFRVVLC